MVLKEMDTRRTLRLQVTGCACQRRDFSQPFRNNQNPLWTTGTARVPIRVRHLQLVFIAMSCPHRTGSGIISPHRLPPLPGLRLPAGSAT